MPNPPIIENVTQDQQLSELAEILAAGLVRLFQRNRRVNAESSRNPEESRELSPYSGSQDLDDAGQSGLSVNTG